MTGTAIKILEKLQSEDISSELGEKYQNIKNHKTLKQLFDILIWLLEKDYDFEFITKEASLLETDKRTLRSLIDSLCDYCGENIEDIITQNTYIISEPSNFEDYCPFPKEEIVLYCNNATLKNTIKYDGYQYKIINYKLENTPYYSIYCYQIEKY